MFNLNTRDDENVFAQRAQSPQRITLIFYSFLWSDRQDAGSAAFAGLQKSCLSELCEKPFKFHCLREMLVARPRNN
ncbi:MAG: hypothetical protein A2096_05770 [Spirochaetes bacterium GWF1_41_5]|nr:MAG: hypothetical protein A2096_05770 [Spirochaetes bacterium GWF1_41_5]HBE04773.1 hypothetical protein [Spirochaetia bacterium]